MIGLKTAVSAFAVGGLEFMAATNFSNTITTGAIISTVVVIAIAGLFTWRAQMASTWKDNYFAEKENREQCEGEIRKLNETLLKEREEQQKVRHDLKNDLAVALMKTDLTVHEAQESARHDEMVVVLKGINQRHDEMVNVLTTMQEAMSEMTDAVKAINGKEA